MVAEAVPGVGGVGGAVAGSVVGVCPDGQGAGVGVVEPEAARVAGVVGAIGASGLDESACAGPAKARVPATSDVPATTRTRVQFTSLLRSPNTPAPQYAVRRWAERQNWGG